MYYFPTVSAANCQKFSDFNKNLVSYNLLHQKYHWAKNQVVSKALFLLEVLNGNVLPLVFQLLEVSFIPCLALGPTLL